MVISKRKSGYFLELSSNYEMGRFIEKAIALVLNNRGFKVQTQKSRGVDIVAVKDSEKVLIECKKNVSYGGCFSWNPLDKFTSQAKANAPCRAILLTMQRWIPKPFFQRAEKYGVAVLPVSAVWNSDFPRVRFDAAKGKVVGD